MDGDTLLDRAWRALATVHEPSVAGLLETAHDLFTLVAEQAGVWDGWHELHRARIAVANIAGDAETLAGA